MLEQVHVDLVLRQRQIRGVIVTETCDLQFDAVFLGFLFEYFPGFLFRVGGANADGGFAIGAGGIAVAGAGDQAGGGYNSDDSAAEMSVPVCCMTKLLPVIP